MKLRNEDEHHIFSVELNLCTQDDCATHVHRCIAVVPVLHCNFVAFPNGKIPRI